MMLLAERAGRKLERRSNSAPRGMAVIAQVRKGLRRNKIRPIGLLHLNFLYFAAAANGAAATLAPSRALFGRAACAVATGQFPSLAVSIQNLTRHPTLEAEFALLVSYSTISIW